jgi:hypothetical protein
MQVATRDWLHAIAGASMPGSGNLLAKTAKMKGALLKLYGMGEPALLPNGLTVLGGALA